MTYTKKQFIEDVKKEASALRKHATKEELDKLGIEILNPHSTDDCLYGQMTGYCRSERAVSLITKCCRRFLSIKALDAMLSAGDSKTALTEIRKHVNGTKSEEPRRIKFISAIETYIGTPFAKNKNLIDYLKGNRNDLVL
jgi:hypothetical protein